MMVTKLSRSSAIVCARFRVGDVASHDGEVCFVGVEGVSRGCRALFEDRNKPNVGPLADELLRERLYEARVLARRRSHREAQRGRRRRKIKIE